ncbi:MAG: class I SAM-dependent methyltransferase [Candidatus Coatesbacteria bacterium]|nr:class I SAM-dependent methyltransferase [Candidatus Coatesbacteria bacterium]
MPRLIDPETSIHGAQWLTLHDGYFSDPTIAAPLLKTVGEAVTASRPQVVVDLGGGTGFLLTELIRQGLVPTTIRLVCLDCSERQLCVAKHGRIRSVCCTLADFRRCNIAQGAERLIFMMRSVLHYFGREGLVQTLRHIRDQANEGELFVHQTASFANKEEADCMNALYQRMRTAKWYPTVEELSGRMAAAGWSLGSISPAPILELTSDDLSKRYGLDGRDIASIREEMSQRFGGMERVFRPVEAGFRAYLPYRIYTCVASDR